jgi:hypothetical protein
VQERDPKSARPGPAMTGSRPGVPSQEFRPTSSPSVRPPVAPLPRPSGDPAARMPVPVRAQPVSPAGAPGSRYAYRPAPAAPRSLGLPNLRRNVCPHFYVTGTRGAIPIQAPHLLKALIRQEQNVSRCQLRGGVHLEQGYVNDVCLTPRFNQCVFYEDELTKT